MGARSNESRRQELELRRTIAERDGYTCWLCGKPIDITRTRSTDPLAATVDHVLPKSKGGKRTLDNLRLAHRSCNAARGSADPKGSPE